MEGISSHAPTAGRYESTASLLVRSGAGGRRLRVGVALLVALPLALGGTDGNAAEEQARFFEREVRPILVENCFKCHGAKKQSGGLRLDSLAAVLAGGDSGPAVVPGKPDQSLMIEAVHYESLEMPPSGRLSDRQVAVLVSWVKAGAFWPDSPAERLASSASQTAEKNPKPGRVGAFSDEDRAWWSFQPVRDPQVREDPNDHWSRNPIDRFVWRSLRDAGLSPAPEADRATLIRRATFDVIGLPPTPAEISAFLSDKAPDAYERVVDRLLASRHYGERWARHWLDLVRYADSDGYRLDHYRPNVWLYRDYVVRSLNADKPYDRFVREQVAGDELYPDDPDALIATGYLRHGIYESNNPDVRGQWALLLNDITDTTGDVMLGLGIQCARCHDHKFDPILQKDYYRLQSFFAPMLPREDLPAAPPVEIDRYRAELAAWEAKTADLREQIAKIESSYRKRAAQEAIESYPAEIQELVRKPVAQRTPLEQQLGDQVDRRLVIYEAGRLEGWIKGEEKTRLQALRQRLAAFDREKPEPLPTPPVVTDVGPESPPLFIPKRKSGPVAPGFLSILDEGPATIEPLPNVPNSTGRRAALARWLTRSDNPLSTRVIVNRIWQYHFGRGLAANSSDFGRLGEAPTHPELLDWLTTRFVREGWSLKRLHRMILTSATYRELFIHPKAEFCRLKDPENRLYWRGNTRRLDAEQIRDAALAVTGELDLTAGGPCVDSSEPRRSIYTRMMRNTRDPLLDAFDLPLFFTSAPARDTTTTPLQSLFLLNSPPMLTRSQAFAARLEWEAPSGGEGLVDAAYQLAFGRLPAPEEKSSALRFLREQALRIDPKVASATNALFLQGCIPEGDGQAAVLTPEGPQRRLDVPHRAPLNTGDFTLEATILVRSVLEGDSMRTIVAKWDGDEKQPGWSFGVTGRGSPRSPQTLVLHLLGVEKGRGFETETVYSEQPIQLGRPYYAAVTVQLANKGPGLVTFYLKDLSDDDEPLRVTKVAHDIVGGFDNTRPLSIGGQWGRTDHGFDGLIDEVRLSDNPVAVNDLLCNNEKLNSHTLGFWRFEAKPGVFCDSTGHGLDLRLPNRASNQGDLRRSSLADFCHVLLNSSEFLYVD
ncbi:Concanavalin A-like lectin/glucanases superfamily protein [Singulisphaera sp. GP187]|uniref:DUF1549 domain-containing protein n=1 Tax=Singulisphaera sp. GP187 TaxID=1882752 RepID=UPI00092765A5|nr:DUF1549 domain-containing protein [Singulisphaera sp. GP187]SIO45026.1 Concanavalin A-like lectin/glucanases superfamily protein [Singulisphaera sp. GP187]